MTQAVVHMGASGDTLPLVSNRYSAQLLEMMTGLYRDITSRMVLPADQALVVIEFPEASIPILHASVATALAFHPMIKGLHLIRAGISDETAMALVVAATDRFNSDDFLAVIEQTVDACGGNLGERRKDIHASWARTRAIETIIGYDESKDPKAKYGGYYGIDEYLADRIQGAGSYEAVLQLLETLRP